MQVLILEETSPPQNETPLFWILLTTLPITNSEEAKYIVDLYLSRWSIEVFFHVLKTGCKIEKLQFKERHPEFQHIFLNEFMLLANNLISN